MTAVLDDAAAILEREVRELVRRRGIDPVRERSALAGLVADAVSDYTDRTTRGLVPALPDAVETSRTLVDLLAGLGPLQQYLDDPTVEEVWLNGPAQVFVARGGQPELTTTILTSAQVRDLVERMLKSSGRRLDLSSPFVDAALPDGSRLHVVIPDVTRSEYAVNIRKHVVRASRLDHLVRLGSLTPHATAFLDAAVRAGLNILVAGATQAGKTTMLNALAGSIPAAQRVITCEEVFELRLDVRDIVAMQCRQPSLEGTGEIPLRRLVKEALRMRPDRIVVGEVREAESFDLLVALNSGVPGMCTIHANSAREAVTKLCTLPLLAGENVTHHFVVPTVASAVDVVVHLGVTPDGERQVREIVGVTGRVEDGRVETAGLFHRESAAFGGRLVRGDGFPPGEERFARAGIDVRALLATEAR
ncbi:type II secretion system protein E [Xylanimonas cellulosilytica DSM 15894]|uniref:Type II secretion system protein E n=1 Tax=Xylanimonas cellulosilytica (strain DSM 15894 / JCM 12276 / CECT 5975 / KCTC 9989 / LMG 20990 / NBRC 107835 / XIL07) TaxID=446471 RepID=D1BYY9_XYLCX|nr:ATPase, T2SS/T4P/T4SS family [Xylanimonas cellulosilytica]ACZ30064.1 type II secretion system protein E [Xylanimonas cellulosilytica DSM 15894]